jgi:hypothetical protein
LRDNTEGSQDTLRETETVTEGGAAAEPLARTPHGAFSGNFTQRRVSVDGFNIFSGEEREGGRERASGREGGRGGGKVRV